MAQERRQFQRVCLDSPLSVLLDDSESGFVFDLGEDGLAFSGLASREPGEVVPFAFDLPEETGRIRGRAEIVWRSGSAPRAGLHFLELADPSRERLAQWISTRVWTIRYDGVEKEYGEPADVTHVTQAPINPAFSEVRSERDYAGMSPSIPAIPLLFNADLESPSSKLITAETLTSNTPSIRKIGIVLVTLLLSSALAFLVYRSGRTRTKPPIEDTIEVHPLASISSESAGSVTPPSTATAESIAPTKRLDEPGSVLQVGAMTHEAYADELAKSLQQRNLPAFVFRREGDPFYRVAVGPFTDTESPARVKDELEKQGFKPFLRPWRPGQD